jgi:hypothetical protein
MSRLRAVSPARTVVKAVMNGAVPGSAAGASGTSGGRAYGAPDRAPAAREAASTLHIPGPRLAGFSRQVEHARKPDGFVFGRSIFVEGLFARIMYRSLRIMHSGP